MKEKTERFAKGLSSTPQDILKTVEKFAPAGSSPERTIVAFEVAVNLHAAKGDIIRQKQIKRFLYRDSYLVTRQINKA